MLNFADSIHDAQYFMLLSTEMMTITSSRNLIGNKTDFKEVEDTVSMLNEIFDTNIKPQEFITSDDKLSNICIESSQKYDQILNSLKKEDRAIAKNMDKTIKRIFEDKESVPFAIHFISFSKQMSIISEFLAGKISKQELKDGFSSYNIFGTKKGKGDFSLLRRFIHYVNSEIAKTVKLEKEKES